MKINHVFLRRVGGYSYNEDQLPLITGVVNIEGEDVIDFELTFSDGSKDYISVDCIKNGCCKFVVQ